jgi:hypothetical protein
MRLPAWLWGGSITGWLALANLTVKSSKPGSDVVEVEVMAAERAKSGRPDYVTLIDLAGASLNPRPEVLETAECTAAGLMVTLPPDSTDVLQRMHSFAVATGPAGMLAPSLSFHQAQTYLATPPAVAAVVKAVQEDLAAMQFEGNGGPAFPTATAQLVLRHHALVQRMRLPAVLLRMEHDDRIRNADLSQASAAVQSGELVFASASALGDGVMLLDAYLAPLFGALSPFVWSFPVTRASGTIIYNLGLAIGGALVGAAEPLQLLPGRGPEHPVEHPKLGNRSGPAAIQWWVRRIDKLLSILSDPAVHSDHEGWYVPSKHLHAILSIEQVFRRTASIQREHHNADARRVLLFSVLDTFDRLTNRRLTDMCDLATTRRARDTVKGAMSGDVADVLMPGAERAVAALNAVQDGFFLRQQTGAANVEFTEADGSTVSLDPADAVAEYIRVLRNATHGHGTNRAERKVSTDALLVHHNGVIPNDLALLAYLYLLELLVRPEMLKRRLYDGGAT